MKYGDNLFGRRDVRPGDARPNAPTPANSPQATPAIVPTPPKSAAAPAPAPATDHSPAPASAHAEEPAGSKLIVGPNIKLKGVEIHDCDTLVVEGRVEATMVSRAIQIADTGAFNGKVDVEIAEIRGNFQGEMTARKRLVVHASGRVSGKIRYGKMLIQEGGEMSGDVGTINESMPMALAATKT